jgi:hypothetical protein
MRLLRLTDGECLLGFQTEQSREQPNRLLLDVLRECLK